MELIELWIVGASDHVFEALGPKGLKAITILYFSGIVFKVLSMSVSTIVNGTKTQVDNELWNKVQSSVIYKIIAWVLDLVLRLGLPKAKDGKKRR